MAAAALEGPSCLWRPERGAGRGAAIDEVRKTGDSCGGEVTCVVRNTPVGLGAPVFDKLEAELAKAVMSLPATKVPPLLFGPRAICQPAGKPRSIRSRVCHPCCPERVPWPLPLCSPHRTKS